MSNSDHLCALYAAPSAASLRLFLGTPDACDVFGLAGNANNNDAGLDESMTMWFKILGAFISIILMVGEAASAEQTPGQASPDWTQNYGERNKDCLEWTDTCVNCVRAQSGENFSCSNIGIACQPKDVACVKRAEEKVK